MCRRGSQASDNLSSSESGRKRPDRKRVSAAVASGYETRNCRGSRSAVLVLIVLEEHVGFLPGLASHALCPPGERTAAAREIRGNDSHPFSDLAAAERESGPVGRRAQPCFSAGSRRCPPH